MYPKRNILADGTVVLDGLKLETPVLVHRESDLKPLNGRNVKILGRYVLYSKIFRQFSEHMRFKFDQRAEGIHFRGTFHIPPNMPQNWAGILLEDGSLVFLFNPDDPRSRRPPSEWKRLENKEVAAYGELWERKGEWGKKLLSYGYADAYLDLDKIETKP
ncbi:MAG TPA: hypothetical protein DF383_13830 [Deltaproteobacteria bacterium]|nr:hypothetical protein [Deltaproteobacteria bacterium]